MSWCFIYLSRDKGANSIYPTRDFATLGRISYSLLKAYRPYAACRHADRTISSQL